MKNYIKGQGYTRGLLCSHKTICEWNDLTQDLNKNVGDINRSYMLCFFGIYTRNLDIKKKESLY